MVKKDDNNSYEEKIRKIAEVLELGVPRVSGDSLQMCCPFHIEGNPSFGINVKNGTYHCFACDAKGHISKIVDNLRSNIIAEKADKIEDFEVSVKVDTVSYSAKPSGREVGAIRNRLVGLSISKYTIDDLLELITTGHTVSLSGAKTNDEWAGQQICMVDIDNDYQTTFQDILRYAKSINLEPTFAYHTYSSTENCCRCRLAYVFKETIKDQQLYQAIANNLILKFAEYSADKACADLCRLFYGTVNKDVFVSNIIYSTRFTSEQLNSIWKSKSRSKASEKKSDEISTDATTDEISDISKYYENKRFRHELLAQDLIEQYHFISLNTLPHFYENGVYKGSKLDVKRLVKNLFPSLSTKDLDEVLTDLTLLSEVKEENDYHLLAFKNGIVNIDEPELKPFSPDVILTSKLNVNFVVLDISDCCNSVVDKFFRDITNGDAELERLLYEIIRLLLCPY